MWKITKHLVAFSINQLVNAGIDNTPCTRLLVDSMGGIYHKNLPPFLMQEQDS